ncbi:MAG: hypothetical protein LBL59_01915 [Xanthomonadaceae bacterium]|jgi:hypothetical protein|nr:hypothetical protein [Xanthomonadaceae bacterium]
MLNKSTIGILLSAILTVCCGTASAQMLNEAQLNALLERSRAEGIPDDVALQRIATFERSTYGAPQAQQPLQAQQGVSPEELLLMQIAQQQQAQMQGGQAYGQPGVGQQIGGVMTDEAIRLMSTIYNNELVRSGIERGDGYRRGHDPYDSRGYGSDSQLDPKAEMLLRVFEDARQIQYQRRYNDR